MTDLEKVMAGEIEPSDAFGIFKEMLADTATDPAEAAERVYETLRSLTFRFVREQDGGVECTRWMDLVLQVRKLLVRRGHAGVAERLTVLYDLLSQTCRIEADRRDVRPFGEGKSLLAALLEAGFVPANVRRTLSSGVQDERLAPPVSSTGTE